jgi:hypothetical protein
MRPLHGKVDDLADEAVAIIVALLAFGGEDDLNVTAAHTVRLIADREGMNTPDALDMVRAVEAKIVGVTGQGRDSAGLLPTAALAVMPPAGQG